MSVRIQRGWGDRLKEAREHVKMTQAELADLMGKGSGLAVIGLYEAEKREPKLTQIQKLSELTGFNVEFLISGKGPKYRGVAPVSADEQMIQDGFEAVLDYLDFVSAKDGKKRSNKQISRFLVLDLFSRMNVTPRQDMENSNVVDFKPTGDGE